MTAVARARTLLDLLAGWVPQQRWYAGKGGGAPELARLGGLLLADDGGSQGGPADVDVVFVRATTPDGVGVTYQVPLDVPLGACRRARACAGRHVRRSRLR